MSRHESPLTVPVQSVLREMTNALGKTAMYPPGHQFSRDAAQRLTAQMQMVLEERESLTIGVTPRGLVIDGVAAEPLPQALRQLAQRLHRRNVGTIHLMQGVTSDELGAMLEMLTARDGDEGIGREGLRRSHLRLDPMAYDVLTFGDQDDSELDELFWTRLVEAALDRQLSDGELIPDSGELAGRINEQLRTRPEGARRVYEALAGFASAIASRGDRGTGTARRRFVDVLSALSRPATTQVMGAAPSQTSRRRFMRETLQIVPPTLLLRILESVADADGEPISPQLRWLLGRLAGTDGGRAVREGGFATQVMALLEEWDGVVEEAAAERDPRVAVEDQRMLGLALETGTVTGDVTEAAQRLGLSGYLVEVLTMLDQPGNSPETVAAIRHAVLDRDLLAHLLTDQSPEWDTIAQVVIHSGAEAVDPLVDALGKSEERTVRRRLLDLLISIGPASETRLLQRLDGAPWYLARNILAVMTQLPVGREMPELAPLLRNDELRVRQEALKVLLRHPGTRDQAVREVLERGEVPMVRVALAGLGGSCPPGLVVPVLNVFALSDADLLLQAIRLIGNSDNPLAIPPLLDLVRVRSGLLRRWKLRPANPVMLAALEVLARRWPAHRPVMMTLQLANRSSDPAIRRAISRER